MAAPDIDRLMANMDVEEEIDTEDLSDDGSSTSTEEDEVELSVSSSESDDEEDESGSEASDAEQEEESFSEESDDEEEKPAPSEDSVAIPSDDDGSDDDSSDDDEGDAPKEGGAKKRKRKNPTKWLREVRHYQKTTELLLPRKPFQRLVREIAEDFKQNPDDIHFTASALDAIQTASEELITELFAKAQNMAIFRGSETLQPKDMHIVLQNQLKWYL